MTVVIEVKCCWHAEVASAMETQLKNRYLIQNGLTHGIYLVCLFASPMWDEDDHRQRKSGNTDKQELEQKYLAQAKELSIDVIKIKSFILDCSLN